MLVVQASNIHQGGGAVLLMQLIKALSKIQHNVVIFVDQRFKVPLEVGANIQIHKVKSKLLHRLLIELRLSSFSKNQNIKYLFFGNLPPLFLKHPEVYLFFQNVIMLKKYNRFKFTLKTRLVQAIERFWIKIRIKNVKTVFVQSKTVKKLFNDEFPLSNVEVFPFFELNADNPVDLELNRIKDIDFIYVASSDPHKNHSNLLKAWQILVDQGVELKLLLTTDRLSAENNHVVQMINTSKKIIFQRAELDQQSLKNCYLQSKALIYPSLAESFGLPLLEAQQFHLPIIASDLDYVHEISKPLQTFDPYSANSIAEAVLKYLIDSKKTDIKAPSLVKLQINSAKEFVSRLMAEI